MCTITEIKESNHIFLLMEQKHKTREKEIERRKISRYRYATVSLSESSQLGKTMQGHYDNYSKSAITQLEYFYKSRIA